MSIAADELRDQLSQTKKNAEAEKPDNAEYRGVNLLSTFPWFYGIVRKFREAIGTEHPNTLNGLLYAFVKELSVSIKDCYSRPNRAGKLRDLVCQILVYISMIDHDLKEKCMDNNNTYLHLMTELLAMYLDLEIKASKRSVHSLKMIGQFMTTALYTHLGQSEDYIIEAILKAKLITKSSGELCAPVIYKVLNDGRCFVGDENAYVRFLLAFKLLQKIARRTDIREVTKMAIRKLDPPPELARLVWNKSNIFPTQKITDKPITEFLMNAKFDFIKAKLEFLKTGSVSKCNLCDIYPEKSFTYSNQPNSFNNLLKQGRKDEQSSICGFWFKNKKSCSTELDLDPSTYRLSNTNVGSVSEKCGGKEDDSEIEFLGTRNRTDKPVVLITLDSDDETAGDRQKEGQIVQKNCLVPSGYIIGGQEKSRTDKKNASNVEDGSDVKPNSFKHNTSNKVIRVPESDGNPDRGGKEENSSTKGTGRVLPSVLQSPEHAVIESTNSFIDSVLDENFKSPIQIPDHAQSNTDDGRTEVSSSLDFVNSTAQFFSKDYLKAREPEITSTRDKSEPFSSTGDEVPNFANDLCSGLTLDSNRDKWDIALIGTPAKKVNYENVLKSYKVVKSKCLKATERPGSPVGESRSETRPTKFIKIDKSSVIGNRLKVEEGVKFVSESLDFRTAKAGGHVSDKGREDRGSAKTVQRKSVGSRTRTSQCVPIIFKKINETKTQTAERKRRGSQRGVSDGNKSRPNQTSKRKHRPHNSNVIKTDINMKSTLKHINPSSIPQFAAEVAKRKYPDVEPNAPKVKCVGNYTPADAPENRALEIKLILPEKFIGLKNTDSFPDKGNEASLTPLIRPCTVQYPINYEHPSYTPIPQADSTQEGSFTRLTEICPTEPSLYCKKTVYPHEIQNGTVEPSEKFFVGNNVDASAAKFEPQRPNSNLFEPDYQDIFPVLNSSGINNPETENRNDDVANEDEISNLVGRQEGLSISEDRRYDHHGRASSLEVGMAFSSVWGSGKVTSSTPRDLIISEISVDELKDTEELRDFVDPWEGSRDWVLPWPGDDPEHDELFLSALPDPVEDFSQLYGTFPSNLNFEAPPPEDFGSMSSFNENFCILQENFPDSDVPQTDESHPGRYESCKKSPRVSSPESQSDDKPKAHYKKGRRRSSSISSGSSSSSSRRKEKAGSSAKNKVSTNECLRSKIGVLGTTEKVDKKKLRSDSVAYHTRSISQKGIPIEYTLSLPKKVTNKKTKTA